MNWDDIRLFLAMARNGRVSVAAKGEGVDSTTLIRRVKKLENALNCSLFELTSRGYILTDQGKRLERYAEKAEHFILEAENELNDERSHLAGTIRVSASEGFGSHFLAPLLAEFKRHYPEICIELVATSGFLNLNKREADIAILLERPTKGLLTTEKLTDYQLNLYAHSCLLEEKGMPENVDDLSPFTLISYVPDLIYAPQLKFFEEAALAQLPALRSTSINAQFQMLSHGAGVGILPKFLATQNSEMKRILSNDIAIKRTFWLATHKETQSQARFKTFIQWLHNQVAQHRNRFLD